MATNDINKCTRCSKITSLIGIAAGIFLAMFKLFIGFAGRSRALIASGMCNIGDVSSAIAVLIGIKYSNKPHNNRYQYGYGKVEFVVQIAISASMFIGTIILVASSFLVIFKKSSAVPGMVVFFAAIASAIANGLIYKYAKCGAKQLNSPAIMAHARHNKIDVIGSLLVALGVLGARIGLHWADPLVAIFECFEIVHGSWVIFWIGIKGLLDTSVPAEYKESISKRVLEVEKILRVSMIRARQSGRSILLDIAIEIDSEASVLMSKKIVQSLRAHLRKNDRHLGSISVQVMPAK